jgi:hypothetical protein
MLDPWTATLGKYKEGKYGRAVRVLLYPAAICFWLESREASSHHMEVDPIFDLISGRTRLQIHVRSPSLP